MARLYADENFPYPVVGGLRKSGHDVLTIQEDGKANRSFSDEDVLSVASADSRALLTINRKHFVRMHMESSRHFGIIVCTFDLDFESQASRIHEIIEAYDSLEGELIRVNRLAT